MDLIIPYKKMKDAKEAFAKVQKAIGNDYLKQFKVSGEVTTDAKKKILTLSGTGFTFTLSFLEKEAQGKLDLALLLRPIKSKVLSTVEKHLRGVL